MSENLGEVATAWMDAWFDDQAGLLWNMDGAFPGVEARTLHLVPGSAWYAVGLLVQGDVDRAVRVISALCATQYDEPGTVWHGTFARFAEWPHPPADGARVWIDYDPNWRQFVGTTFALILADFGALLPAPTLDAMRAAIALAVEGEPIGRVPASYSNIALMKAWLDVEAGRVAEGEAFAAEVVALFERHGAFLEYGSPTYYGIDFYALALWRSRSSSPLLQAWGAQIEAALWRDVGRWYHAGLRNLCGPYARAYGVDMTGYVGLLGLWIWEAVGREHAPFPWPLPDVLDHGHDFCLGPCVSLLGARVPDDVMPALRDFPGEHTVTQVVDAGLGFEASGWLGPDVMIGAARGSRARAEGQYHPATIHWRGPDGSVAWLRLRHTGPLHATAGPGWIEVTTEGEPTVESSHPGTFTADRWEFPGLTLEVSPVDENTSRLSVR